MLRLISRKILIAEKFWNFYNVTVEITGFYSVNDSIAKICQCNSFTKELHCNGFHEMGRNLLNYHNVSTDMLGFSTFVEFFPATFFGKLFGRITLDSVFILNTFSLHNIFFFLPYSPPQRMVLRKTFCRYWAKKILKKRRSFWKISFLSWNVEILL